MAAVDIASVDIVAIDIALVRLLTKASIAGVMLAKAIGLALWLDKRLTVEKMRLPVMAPLRWFQLFTALV